MRTRRAFLGGCVLGGAIGGSVVGISLQPGAISQTGSASDGTYPKPPGVKELPGQVAALTLKRRVDAFGPDSTQLKHDDTIASLSLERAQELADGEEPSSLASDYQKYDLATKAEEAKTMGKIEDGWECVCEVEPGSTAARKALSIWEDGALNVLLHDKWTRHAVAADVDSDGTAWVVQNFI